MRVLAILAAVGALGALPLAAQPTPAPGTVLRPGAGALPDAFPAVAPGGTSLGSAAIIVACGVAGAWLWWRMRRNGAAGLSARGERKLTVAETRPLGNRQFLVVADYEGTKFLLGVCPGRIQLLAPLAEEKPSP
jgi:flagellar protein FliO/FliZ